MISILRLLVLSLDDEYGVPVMAFYAISDLANALLGEMGEESLNNSVEIQDGRAFLKEGKGWKVWKEMIEVRTTEEN